MRKNEIFQYIVIQALLFGFVFFFCPSLYVLNAQLRLRGLAEDGIGQWLLGGEKPAYSFLLISGILGLFCYRRQWRLETVVIVEIAVIAALSAASFYALIAKPLSKFVISIIR